MQSKNCPKVEKHAVVFSQSCRRFQSFALRILEYGNVETRTADPSGEHFSHLYRLNYLVEGHQYYLDGNRRIDLEPGCLVFLPPNAMLKMDDTQETVKILFVNFELGSLDKREDFREFMDSLFPFSHVHDVNSDLLKIMEEIQRIGSSGLIGSAMETQNLFENLFLHVVRLSQNYREPEAYNPATGTDTIVSSAMTYINANLHRNFRLGDMAEFLNISENYLYKIFVKSTGKSPAVFIAEMRMELAKSSLANPNLQIKAIAANLGYESRTHFSTAFKKMVGESPAEYRKRILSQRIEDGCALHANE